MKALVRLVSIQLFVLLFSISDAPFAEEEPSFSQRELDRMLAPIALYPDVVLSQILMAATYPLEVVEAARWSKANPDLDGEEAVAAVADTEWDASVQALVAFPRILARMDEDLDWTKRLGDAFLFQEVQVMETVQDMRQKAYAAGNLDDQDRVRVIQDGDTIVIEPADPRVVYIPYYDTRVIYGRWWWPGYAPHYWAPPPGYYAGGGFYWGSGVLLAPGFYVSHFNWPHRHIVIVNAPRAYPHTPGHAHRRGHAAPGGGHQWRHDPRHRHGVVYRDRGYNHPYGRPRASAADEAEIGAPNANIPRSGHYRQGSRNDSATVDRGGRGASLTGRNGDRRAQTGAGVRPDRYRASRPGRETASAAPEEVPRVATSDNRRGDASPRSPRAQSSRQARRGESEHDVSPRASVVSPDYGPASRQGVSMPAPVRGGQRVFIR